MPLAQLATVKTLYAPTSYTHQNLQRTVYVVGYRRYIAVTALYAHVTEALKDLQLPRGYTISHEGEMKEMNASFSRLGQSLALCIVLLAVVLVIAFRSFVSPIAILATLPLAVICAAWAMMIAGKHCCMPSFMGLILLMGIVVKNGILLVYFAQEALARGVPLKQAILQAVDCAPVPPDDGRRRCRGHGARRLRVGRGSGAPVAAGRRGHRRSDRRHLPDPADRAVLLYLLYRLRYPEIDPALV